MANGTGSDQGSGVGSGNPNQGSGWTNFDRFLNDANVQWGASQNDFLDDQNDFTTGPAFSNYLIQAGHKPGWDPAAPSPEIPPEWDPSNLNLGSPVAGDNTPAYNGPPITTWDEYMADPSLWNKNNNAPVGSAPSRNDGGRNTHAW